MLKGNGDRRLADYLLGRLGEPEQAEIERRYFEDPDFLECLEMAEEELIDAYIRGELGNEDRQRFEEHFLRSPGRRRKVEVARAFLKSLPPPRRSFRHVYTLAAAVLIAALGLSWLLRSTRPPAEFPPPVQTGAEGSIISFSLSPNLTRDSGEGNFLRVPPEAAQVELRLSVHSSGSYHRYRAILETAEGDVVLRWESAEPEMQNSHSIVALRLPASAIPANDYIVTLQGLSAAGEYEKLPSYIFRVSRQ